MSSIVDRCFFNFGGNIIVPICVNCEFSTFQGNFKEMEASAETSIAVFFGLQGIPNALEDSENPKVRYKLDTVTYSTPDTVI
jgi:hypothetical protein